MENKSSEIINNICTILGGALLLYPLIDEATKTIIPEMQKLTSGEALHELKSLPVGQEKHDMSERKDDSKHDIEHKAPDDEKDEIAELKRKLAEYEQKQQEELKTEN